MLKSNYDGQCGDLQCNSMHGGAAIQIRTNIKNAVLSTSDRVTSVQHQLINKRAMVAQVSDTEIGCVNGVTSSIQTELIYKQASITGGATTITPNNLVTTRASLSEANGQVAVSSANHVELGYFTSASRSIQTR